MYEAETRAERCGRGWRCDTKLPLFRYGWVQYQKPFRNLRQAFLRASPGRMVRPVFSLLLSPPPIFERTSA